MTNTNRYSDAATLLDTKHPPPPFWCLRFLQKRDGLDTLDFSKTCASGSFQLDARQPDVKVAPPPDCSEQSLQAVSTSSIAPAAPQKHSEQ